MLLALLVLSAELVPAAVLGPHGVGFQVVGARDASRLLEGAARPVQIGVWYPAAAAPGTPLAFGDYVALAAAERTLDSVTPEQARGARDSWKRFLTGNGVAEPALDAWLEAPTHARSEAAAAAGRFPLVLVAQGNGQTLADQAVLAELVASHGYVVATSPSQIRLGASMESEADVLPNAREQARDLAFVAVRVAPLPFVDAHQLAFVGHSFGARSALLAALQEPRSVALVSLDGGIGAATAKAWLDADTGLDPAAARFALLHLYETEDAMMAPDFALFERMRSCARRLVRVPSLHHRHFSSYGFAAAAIPDLKDADAGTVSGIQTLAAQAIAFLDAAFGRPAAVSLAAEPLPGVTWSPDTATRRAVPGPVSRLRVDDGGASDRTPVVFVHGNGASLTHWSEALVHVRASRRAVALDLRGNGESQPVREARFGVGDVAEDVGAVADALGLRRFVLVGHSYGGSVVGAYAAAHPERVAGLLLVDPAGDVTQAPADALDRYVTRLKSADYARVSRAALQASLAGAKPETSLRVLAALAAASPEAFVGSFEGLRHYDPVAALRGYPGEVFVILQPQRENEATAVHRLLPALRYATLPGVSHFLMLDDPPAFARLLDGFLERADPR